MGNLVGELLKRVRSVIRNERKDVDAPASDSVADSAPPSESPTAASEAPVRDLVSEGPNDRFALGPETVGGLAFKTRLWRELKYVFIAKPKLLIQRDRG
jgi:hypothetical protein